MSNTAREIASAMTAAARPGAAQDVVRIDPVTTVGTNKLRVAAYARVSTRKEDQANSYEAQVSYYNRLITNNDDWELADIYADEAVIIGLKI